MANEFVRKIRKTDVSKEPLATNTEGDIILDKEKGAYIRYKDEYRKISGISNLTFNTEHVTLKNTTHDGTKRIELSEELLNKINNPIQSESFSVRSTNTENTFTLRNGNMYVVRCTGADVENVVYLGFISTKSGKIYLNEIKAVGISVTSNGLDLIITPDRNYIRIHIERVNLE